jgi:DNA repair protein RecN (Recombination protein N)
LLREETHLTILDQFGGLYPLRSEYATAFETIVPLIRKEQDLVNRQAHLDEQLALLGFQAEEIDQAQIQEAEDETLEKERRRLKNGATLFELVQSCAERLYSGEGAVVETLQMVIKTLGKAAVLDDRLAETATELEALGYRAEDLAAGLNAYLKRLDLDPRQLDAVEARLDLINKLKRKYGGSLDAVLAHGREAHRQMEEIENLEETLSGLRAELERRHRELCALAEQLSAQRRNAAAKLAGLAEGALAELKMANTRFDAVLQPTPAGKGVSPFLTCSGCQMTESGIDRATFMIAPNVGEAIKPLAAIASGGELSRVVLALKAILAGTDAVETLVFDEVDAGIGGAVADVVGQKLRDLARRHQVLCITHQAQIARYGDHHFQIQKNVSRGRTYTTIAPLSEAQRIEEIARMIGGEHITAVTLAHAREMLAAKRSPD